MVQVRPGDTLFGIANRHQVPLRRLIDANPQVTDPNRIYAGQQLRLPQAEDAFEAKPGLQVTPSGLRRAALQRGMTGGAVRELQRQLVAQGHLSARDYQSGPGIFGPRTEAAVRRLQSRVGLQPTGLVGPSTWAALLQDGFQPHDATTVTDAPRTLAQSSSLRSTRRWETTQAPLASLEGQRTRALYDAVIDQFDVARNPRYARRGGDTWCNIFAWDVTRAMGAEVPHWASGRELDANSMHRWLAREGAARGWRRVTAQEAQTWANLGRPAVATWYNPQGTGHVAIVRPGALTGRGPTIAQAGARNFNHGQLQDGFGQRPAVFWVHP